MPTSKHQSRNPAESAVRRLDDLRGRVVAWRRAGHRIGLVPTMGALHEGHLALMRRARAECDRVIVSIFVNPTQFGPQEDFTAYPRREAEDLAKLLPVGVDLAWLPEIGQMYPDGFATHVAVEGLTDQLCGRFRPGHFRGVTTVVAKLLHQCQADAAYFGEKDYQQLQVIRRMVRDLDLAVAVIGVPTVREPDGLALSSRNLYLSAEARQKAALLPRVLRETADLAARGDADLAALVEDARRRLETGGFDSVDYVAIRDADSLMPIEDLSRPARLLAAAWLGRTRLIDNIPVLGP